ncbi:MAG: non-ribosomal peptide synthetase, partial [Burkholderiales bacterium]
SIIARFERQVQDYPDRLALKSGNRALTYTALNSAANRVANALLARSEGPEPIALLLKSGIAAVTAILGTLKAGKFYVPLDPGFPQARLAAIASNAEPRLVVTDNANLALASVFVEDRAQIVNVDDLTAVSDRNPGLAIAPDAYAYLLYTSGSTGQPKGVIQNHRNVLHQLITYTKGLAVGAEDRLTLLHSYGFSASRLDIFGALLSGAGLFHFAVADNGLADLARWLREEEITLLHWVPTAFRQLAGVFDDLEQFPSLRLVVLGSEALSVRDIALYKKHFSPDCVLVNRFGTTETGNICWHFIDKNSEHTSGAVPVGRAIEDTEVLVLDETGEDAAVGQVGEIAVRSAYLSPGYWRQPESTQSAFAPDPTDAGRKIYRTGDMGYKRGDGSLVHAGRKDLQAKVRGYRVEIGEIESALLAHSAVREAAVAVGEEDSGAQKLLAYMVARKVTRPTNGALRSYLEARLPAHMTPSSFIWLESLPLTPSGKLDRLALPRVEQILAELDADFAEPRTPVELALAGIWSKVLGVARVGVHDSFFELGGHSLSAAQILQRVVRVFGVEVQLRDFFDSPTIGCMAEIIGRERAQDCDDDLGDLFIQSGFMSEDETYRLLKEVDGARNH